MRTHLFDLTSAARRADEQLSAMGGPARDELAARAQERASALGLVRGTTPIPLVLSPSALPREDLADLGRGARLVVSALVKVARDLIEERPEKARLLFHHLSPLELEALATRRSEAEELLHGRVDWFVDREGRPKALEVNATIPAMQVYSDAAVRGWLEARGARVAGNPSNAEWLVDALLRGARSRKAPLRVQLLHREGDPQRAELVELARILAGRGVEARTCTPADVRLDGDPRGVVYRHLFARYVTAESELGKAFLDPERHGIWNRVDGWLETKGLFAELSLQAGARFLTAEEQAAVEELVPWSRLLDDVADAELGDGARFVLKKSHDYGGKSVVIGHETGAAAFRAALTQARADEPGSWIAQELVDAPPLERWLCTPSGAVRKPLFLDISTYASLIEGVPDGGSVVRAAPGRIVNIAGGGGVAPLFADDVLEEALSVG